MSHETTYTYVYFLQAVKAGKYVIAPAVFTLKNKTYASDSLYIEVVGNQAQNQNSGSAGRSAAENSGVESHREMTFSLIFHLTGKKFIWVSI